MFEVVHQEPSNKIDYDLGTNSEMRCVHLELMALFLQQVYVFLRFQPALLLTSLLGGKII